LSTPAKDGENDEEEKREHIVWYITGDIWLIYDKTWTENEAKKKNLLDVNRNFNMGKLYTECSESRHQTCLF
jgi:hypothetical protein